MQTYPRNMSIGGGGQPFINSNFKSPVRNTPTASVNPAKPVSPTPSAGKTGYKYPRGSGNQVKEAFPKVVKSLMPKLYGRNNAKSSRLPVKSKPTAGQTNYNPQS